MNDLVMEIGYKSAGAFAVNTVLNSSDVSALKTSDNIALNYLKAGVILEAVERTTNFVRTGEMDMDWKNAVDDSVFNGLSLFTLNQTNVLKMINQATENIPVGNNVKDAVSTGLILTATNAIRNKLKDTDLYQNTPLKYVLHVTSLLQQ